MRDEYARRREFVVSALNEIPGFRCAPPDGAFYVFPNVADCMSALGQKDAWGLCRFLLNEALVATVPGSAFGLEGYLRISYATSTEALEEACSRIRRACEALS